jgi:hypothetical protein
MTAPHYLRVAIGLRKTIIAELTAGSQTVHDKFVANAATFVAPPVTMVEFQAQIADVNGKHQSTKTNKKAVGARTQAVGVLWTSLELLCTYTQSLMDRSPESAQAIADASGFQIHHVVHAQKALLAASLTTNKGEVLLDAYASKLEAPGKKPAKNRLYRFRGSQDGWKTITEYDPSPTHKTLLKNLSLNTDWEFEVAVQDSTGLSAWQGTTKIHVF